ncbi:MAG TPA: histone deacetylase [Limnobacter sp.]|nr:histone deacetylase [Limnobacter sp.]
MIEAFYTDEFVLPLPPGHRFPMEKYRILRDKVKRSNCSINLLIPPAATPGQLALAHCPDYVGRIEQGNVSSDEQREIGFPWSELMVERSKRSTGATVAAVRSALMHGASVNLAGGTHHAKHDRGGGFCVFNDMAVAARVFQTDFLYQSTVGHLASFPQAAQKAIPRVLVVDLDVHQGDGTAEILAGDDSIFTFSMHGQKNYPFVKARSDLDVELPDGTGDCEYLQQLESALCHVLERFEPQLLLYVAGLDAHEADRLGRLSLSDEGIRLRDHAVLKFAEKLNLPVAAAMAGGYFRDLEHLTDLQLGTIERLARYGAHYAGQVELRNNSN